MKWRSPVVPSTPRKDRPQERPSPAKPHCVAPGYGAKASQHKGGFGVRKGAGVLLRGLPKGNASPPRFQLANCAYPGEPPCFLFFHKILSGAMFSSLPPLSQIQGVATGRDVIAAAAGAVRGRSNCCFYVYRYGWPRRPQPSPEILKPHTRSARHSPSGQTS